MVWNKDGPHHSHVQQQSTQHGGPYGLGQVKLFTELGFDVTVLIQGSPDPSMRPVWADLLAQHDLDIDFDVFAGPFAVGDCLRKGNYSLACVADWVHQEVASTGIPYIFANQLRPWLEGIGYNINYLQRTLESAR